MPRFKMEEGKQCWLAAMAARRGRKHGGEKYFRGESIMTLFTRRIV